MTSTDVSPNHPAQELFSSPELAGPAAVAAGHELLNSFTPASAGWPSTAEVMREIEAAVQAKHGPPPGPTPPQAATWGGSAES